MSDCPNYVMISFSDDGGETWSHEQFKPLIDCHKNYLNRVIIHGRGGSAYGRVYKLRYSEAGSFTLVEAHADIEVGI